jgi:hypothetical protein
MAPNPGSLAMATESRHGPAICPQAVSPGCAAAPVPSSHGRQPHVIAVPRIGRFLRVLGDRQLVVLGNRFRAGELPDQRSLSLQVPCDVSRLCRQLEF